MLLASPNSYKSRENGSILAGAHPSLPLVEIIYHFHFMLHAMALAIRDACFNKLAETVYVNRTVFKTHK